MITATPIAATPSKFHSRPDCGVIFYCSKFSFFRKTQTKPQQIALWATINSVNFAMPSMRTLIVRLIALIEKIFWSVFRAAWTRTAMATSKRENWKIYCLPLAKVQLIKMYGRANTSFRSWIENFSNFDANRLICSKQLTSMATGKLASVNIILII